MISHLKPDEKILVWWGLFWGVFGLAAYFLGLAGFWYRPSLIGLFAIVLIAFVWYGQKQNLFLEIIKFLKNIFKIAKSDHLILFFMGIFGVFTIINLLAALAPEVGFDALWYHLTLPKIYLETHRISYLPGGLFYYSVMPRLVEMFYGFGLAITSNGLLAKLIHFSFGLAWFGASYLFLRLYLSRRLSIFGALSIYTTMLVANLSGTAYIDLAVAFYAAMSFWAFFRYFAGNRQYLIYAAVFFGLVLSSKLYGLMLLPIFIFLLLAQKKFKDGLIFVGLALLIPLPFYLQAFLATGNPLYPLFSVADNGLAAYLNGYPSLSEWYRHVWALKLPGLFYRATVFDFTPILALGIFGLLNRSWRKMVIPAFIFLAFFIAWALQPMWEPRYFLLILPVGILLAVWSIENIKFKPYQVSIWALGFVVVAINLVLVIKNDIEPIKAVFSLSTRQTYMAKNLPAPLNYSDPDGKIKNTVGENRVLAADIHNLFYVNFPFTEWTTVQNQYTNLNEKEIFEELKKDGYAYLLEGKTDKPSFSFQNHVPAWENDFFRLYQL